MSCFERTALVVMTASACVAVGCGALIGIEDRDLGDPHPDASSLESEAGEAAASVPPPFDSALCGSPTREQAATIDESCAVFVSPSGLDVNPGTRALPMQSLKAAAQTAIARKINRVFACAGTYAEGVEFGEVGVSIAGGMNCDQGLWSVNTFPSTVRPTKEGPALRLAQTKNLVVFEALRFEAMSAATPGASSVAVALTNVVGVTFIGSEIVAGTGSAGPSGADGEVATGGGQPGNTAGVGGPGSGAPQKSCTCTLGTVDFGTTVGGAGGYGSTAPTAGLPARAAGGAGANGTPCTGGTNGSNGPSGSTPPTPTVAGTLKDGVWAPTAGTDGTAGAIAQGGGGGGSYLVVDTAVEYVGGGGGCGGCPSTGATGGHGGGASIGITSLDSGVTLVDTKIETAQAGAGGNGGTAPSGQAGGAGQANASGYGCAGGTGGTGGEGGHGRGGAGGSSIGIVHHGIEPQVDDKSAAKFVIGAAGTPGKGRIPGPTHFELGPAGVSEKIFRIID